MNYDGDYFPEEGIPEKREISKTGKVIKKIFKIIGLVLVIAVWVAILGSIILRGDDGILNTPVLSDKAREIYSSESDEFVLYRVYTREFMNEDGSVQLKETVYAENANELEIGVRIAWTQLRFCKECNRIYTSVELEDQDRDDEKNNTKHSCKNQGHTVIRTSETDRGIYYTLTDTKKNSYKISNTAKRDKGIRIGSFSIKYEYLRIAFSDVYFDIDKNIVNMDLDKAKELGQNETEYESGTRFYLNIYDEVTNDIIFTTCIYDNNTGIKNIDFKYPKKEYLN